MPLLTGPMELFEMEVDEYFLAHHYDDGFNEDSCLSFSRREADPARAAIVRLPPTPALPAEVSQFSTNSCTTHGGTRWRKYSILITLCIVPSSHCFQIRVMS